MKDHIKEPTIDQIIERAVSKSMEAFSEKSTEDNAKEFDYYKATEKLLFNYPKLKEIVSDKNSYISAGLSRLDQGKSKSITHFSPNISYRDPEALEEEKELERAKSYNKTKSEYEFLNGILSHFRDDPKFRVIEMYYFNYDIQGMPRDINTERWTFENMAAEIVKEDGSNPDEKTVRKWRSQLVSDISVVLFGRPAALSNSLTRYRTPKKTPE